MNIASTEKMMEEDDIEVSIMESLFKRLRKIYQLINDGPFVMDLDSDTILCEVYKQSLRVENEKLDDTDFSHIFREFQTKFKWYHAASISMMFLYAVLSIRVNPHFETLCLIRKIEKQYKYRPLMNVIQDHVSMLKERMVECGLMGYDQLLELKVHKNPIINVYVKNNFSGNISDMHLAHADVAVGVAESGSNVYHHKNER